MTKLEYTFKSDTLFKSVFVKYQDLLKRLVAELLAIPFESIESLAVINSDITPEMVNEKYCRLDITMTVDGKRVDLEIQVADEGNYLERSLYYWAREFSSALETGGEYKDLPCTVVISIVAFTMFECAEFHSEFQLLEVTRHTLLTDKQVLHYFELPKLPAGITADDELRLWLALFNAETEEELTKIEETGVPVMKEAINAYRQVTATDEFRELERMRSYARHNEASALGHARREGEKIGEKRAYEKWQGVVANKDAALAEQMSENERLRRQLAELQSNRRV